MLMIILTNFNLTLVPIFCFKKAFRNLGRKIENGARSMAGKDQKFNPYKRGFKNSKELGAKILEDVYDYGKTKKKTDKVNRELQRMAAKSGLEIDDLAVNKNLFKKIGEIDEPSSSKNLFGKPPGFDNYPVSKNRNKKAFNFNEIDNNSEEDNEDSCSKELEKIKSLLSVNSVNDDSNNDYIDYIDGASDMDDGPLSVEGLQKFVSRKINSNSIQILPQDRIERKEVITISRRI
ncbi:hypothetical protein CDIK_0791 [Cucumispora dikerogammari]|nr:hypothetical protein CDIK_0791 [Cucumispora dikerogammari]